MIRVPSQLRVSKLACFLGAAILALSLPLGASAEVTAASIIRRRTLNPPSTNVFRNRAGWSLPKARSGCLTNW